MSQHEEKIKYRVKSLDGIYWDATQNEVGTLLSFQFIAFEGHSFDPNTGWYTHYYDRL